MLKKAIIHGKNSMFHKTANGAAVGDLYMALIATAKLAGAEPFDDLHALQRHAEEVAATPVAWMPWNDRATQVEPARTTGPPQGPVAPSPPARLRDFARLPRGHDL